MGTETAKTEVISERVKPRIEWIDVIKGILIIFVLLTHSNAPDIYSRFFSPFFLTMFFFVSGYTFSTKKNFGVFIIGKIKHLIIPLISMGAIKILISVLIKKEDLFVKVKGLLFQISGQADDLWFISCMFTSSLLFYVVVIIGQNVNKKLSLPIVLFGSLLLSAVGWYSVLFLHAKWPWQLENALIMTLYMSLGYIYKNFDGRIYQKNRPAAYVIAIVSGILYLVLYILFDSNADMHNGIYMMPAVFILRSFISIPWIIILAKSICKTNVLKKMLIFLGKNTLFLYAFENYVILAFFMICNKLHISEPYYVASLLCVALAIVVLLPFAVLVNRFLPWMVGGKKETSVQRKRKPENAEEVSE